MEQLKKDLLNPLLEDSGALRYGEFTLASGKKSEYYFDSSKLTLSFHGAVTVATEIVNLLGLLGIKHVGGVACGAIPIVSQVVLLSNTEYQKKECFGHISAFYIRQKAKGHGTEHLCEGHIPPPGEPVAIVDDVVTTGASLLDAICKAESAGCLVTHAITLLDRDEGGREAVEAAGYKFWSLLRVEQTGRGIRLIS